ncbi:trimethylamine-N-oxide reductase (cytochrome c) [Rhodospirillum rubrum F11]|uniref:Dimethyl sulfoxide/trimethylamine N-oxide reductase n=1 Tax=Rhodospirillum rubrum (strain ATCC 11170 / ATH 1.1.1 / DSM 467 / LMG 4362 / NCIMB 8255 / S1) TaxID=269796 RepID=Q2RUV7_RHORT|nr:trimethylamine-N-oxide reductase TorA [Rhodospirillum rubrum]ABC22088.1 Trimethylamine-N-oxide reductase (cytochrome c) [Rhodospirillum rubrum ATCC 11170]AEO47802.1 trimethylamine-N-oxide reductase (cytochrome c) [Rhodospirillum rubrum F11]MBK5953678.1 trimethylamine N-oxide reductase catalytic subunit TorA [Rhodospirillum rubrum]QXG81741.1 trimethylamine-N-oxide reductase TorA [Rhodospirillum rubrum]
MSKMSPPTAFAAQTRRTFLKASAAAGALGLVAPSLLSAGVARAAEDGEVLTGSHWGAFRATVKGGKMTAIKPWEKDPHPSHQLTGVMDSIYSPTRIKYPMVRRAFLEKGPGASPETRGAGDFVRVTWDQALDLVAKELTRVRKDHGPTSIFAGSYGWMSPGKLHNCRSLVRRLLNQTGGFVSSSGDYSTGASQVIMPHVMGTLEVYEQPTVWPVVVEHSDLVVFWGADPMTTNQIGWLIPDHGAYVGLKALKESGKKVICIDPVRTETCDYLGAEWIAPKPQTDMAMMLGVAHTLYTEKLHDQSFLDDYTFGFDRFLPYLTGESDKTPKSAEWASAICGIPAEVIKDLARRIVKGRTMLASGWSMQRQHHGEQIHWMLVTLASMVGQIGLPGGGFGLSYHYANGGSPSATGPVLPAISDGSAAVKGAAWLAAGGAASIPVARVVDMLMNPGKEFDFNGTKAIYPDTKLIYWTGGNPFAHHQNRNRMVEAFRKVETFIVHDFQWTATARHADIVLPATTSYERNDIEQIGDYALSSVLAMKKVVEPVFEARSDFDILAAVAERLGTRDAFTEGKDEMGWIKEFYDNALGQAKAKGVTMPDFETFWKGEGVVSFPISDEAKAFVRYSAFREDPLLEPLGTPTGKIEIYSKNIEKMGYDDCPAHPTWMEPVERLDGPGAKFPLHITTSHPKSRLHSQLCGTKLRDSYTVAGREPCLINEADAKARGISNGDVVRVFNDRGQILAGAVVTNAIRPGVIRVNEGGWYDPTEPTKPGSLCKYGDVNVLTVDIGTSKLAQGNCGHTAIGDVEKYAEAAPAVTVFAAPKNA